jgi:hypothetical protein
MDLEMKKIHIGFHKTGTTFLQSYIFPNVPNYIGRTYEKNGKSNDNSQSWTISGKMKEIDNYEKPIFLSWEFWNFL